MASQALYRKWRSQTFSDLIGQEPVVRALKNGLRLRRPAHAYLFCGPRGTGKTSTARLLAKTLNCQNPQDGEPCNACLNCREITEGRSLDVIEIDAASNRGIDEIRTLREKVVYSPGSGTYKVYVLDEAHMLTPEACNALLKTLEEPPPHVIFVLATTEAHRILPTILSRCQRFDFKRLTLREIVGRLEYVAEQEGWKLEPGAAELLARAAAGGMRDALSLLDRAAATLGPTVTGEGVRQMLGLADPRLVRELVEHIAYLRGAEGLHLINRLAEAGADLRQLSAQVAEYWRALMLAKAGADVVTVLDRSPEDAAEIGQLAGLFALDELSACARLFAQNDVGARSISIPQLAVELAFVDCLHLHRQRTSGAAQPPAVSGSRQAPLPAPHVGPAPGAPPPQRGPVPHAVPFTSDAPGAPARGSTLSSPAAPLDQSLSDGAAGAREETWSAEASKPVEARWSCEGEAAPEPLIPELRAQAASVREQLPAFSGGSAQAGASVPLTVPALSMAQVVSAQENEQANWAEGEKEASRPAGQARGDAGASRPAGQARGDTGAAGEAGAVPPGVSLSLSSVIRQWEMVKKACKTRSPKLAALLNNAHPVAVFPLGNLPEVVIQVEFEFHYRQLVEPASREMIVWALGQILEMPCKIRLLQQDEPIPPSSTFVAPTLSSPTPTEKVRAIPSAASRQGGVQPLDTPAPEQGGVQPLDTPAPEQGGVQPLDTPAPEQRNAQPLCPPVPTVPMQFPSAASAATLQMPTSAGDSRRTANGYTAAPAVASSVAGGWLSPPQNGVAAPNPPPPADLLKEMVLRDPVVEEVLRTYHAHLVKWEPLED